MSNLVKRLLLPGYDLQKEQAIQEAVAELWRLNAEVDALRAKIEAMEQQEPVATVIKEGDSRYWMSERLWTFPDGKYPLYALSGAQLAPSVPDGWKLVPIEPTPEMLASAWGIDACDIAGTYAAMLAAAPEAKPCQ